MQRPILPIAHMSEKEFKEKILSAFYDDLDINRPGWKKSQVQQMIAFYCQTSISANRPIELSSYLDYRLAVTYYLDKKDVLQTMTMLDKLLTASHCPEFIKAKIYELQAKIFFLGEDPVHSDLERAYRCYQKVAESLHCPLDKQLRAKLGMADCLMRGEQHLARNVKKALMLYHEVKKVPTDDCEIHYLAMYGIAQCYEMGLDDVSQNLPAALERYSFIRKHTDDANLKNNAKAGSKRCLAAINLAQTPNVKDEAAISPLASASSTPKRKKFAAATPATPTLKRTESTAATPTTPATPSLKRKEYTAATPATPTLKRTEYATAAPPTPATPSLKRKELAATAPITPATPIFTASPSQSSVHKEPQQHLHSSHKKMKSDIKELEEESSLLRSQLRALEKRYDSLQAQYEREVKTFFNEKSATQVELNKKRELENEVSSLENKLIKQREHDERRKALLVRFELERTKTQQEHQRLEQEKSALQHELDMLKQRTDKDIKMSETALQKSLNEAMKLGEQNKLLENARALAAVVMLQQYNESEKKLQQLRAELESAKKQATQLHTQLTQATAGSERLQSDLTAERLRLQGLQQLSVQTQANFQENLQQQHAKATSAILALERRVEEELQKQKTDATEFDRLRQTLQLQIDEATQKYDGQTQILEEKAQVLAAKERALEETRDLLLAQEAQNKTLQAKMAELNDTLGTTTTQMEQLKTQSQFYKTQLEQTEAANEKLQKQLADNRLYIENLSKLKETHDGQQASMVIEIHRLRQEIATLKAPNQPTQVAASKVPNQTTGSVATHPQPTTAPRRRQQTAKAAIATADAAKALTFFASPPANLIQTQNIQASQQQGALPSQRPAPTSTLRKES